MKTPLREGCDVACLLGDEIQNLELAACTVMISSSHFPRASQSMKGDDLLRCCPSKGIVVLLLVRIGA